MQQAFSPALGRWVLFATILASSMAFIDSTALNVALPALQADLGASGPDLLWIVNAYTLLLAALLLVGGALGDRFGRRRVFMLGIGLFAGASLLCGLAPGIGLLIAARALQGVGGALMVPGSLALLAALFPPDQRGRAVGTWSSFSTVTTMIGPALGGLLAQAGLWRAVFLINLPLAALTLWALWRHIPESRDERAASQIDYPGATLATLGLCGLTYGCIEAARRGFGAADVLTALLGGLAALTAFGVVEARSAHPMVPLRLFRSRSFSGANAMTLFLYAGLSGSLFFLPLNLIQAQGYDPALVGLTLLPFSLMLALLSRWAGGLADRLGPRLLLTAGPALAAAGFGLYALPGLTGGPRDYWTTFLPATLVLGLGMACTVAPLSATVIGSAPPENAGVASGISNAVSRVAGVLAVALLGGAGVLVFRGALESHTATLGLPEVARAALLASAADLGETKPPTGLPPETAEAVRQAVRLAFVDTFRLIMLVAAGLAAVAALLSALLIRGQERKE